MNVPFQSSSTTTARALDGTTPKTGRLYRQAPELTRAGYLVLITERRGYSDSEGTTLLQDISNDWGSEFVAWMEAETYR